MPSAAPVSQSKRPLTLVSGRFPLGPGGAALVAVAGLASAALGQLTSVPDAKTSETPSPPASAPSGPVRFQPGVMIDWHNGTVIADSRVVLRRGPLEFLACGPGKEHESILRLEASATHLYLALGMIGLTPGHPPTWDQARCEFEPPAGDLVDVRCEWYEDEQHRLADAFAWLRQAEYARTPIPRPWVFAGSLRLSDGTLAADRSGVGIALVDFPDSLLLPSLEIRVPRNTTCRKVPRDPPTIMNLPSGLKARR